MRWVHSSGPLSIGFVKLCSQGLLSRCEIWLPNPGKIWLNFSKFEPRPVSFDEEKKEAMERGEKPLPKIYWKWRRAQRSPARNVKNEAWNLIANCHLPWTNIHQDNMIPILCYCFTNRPSYHWDRWITKHSILHWATEIDQQSKSGK